MHKSGIYFTLFLSVLIISCGAKQKKILPSIPIADTSKFYPIENFIQLQIKYVDLRNFLIEKIYTIDGISTHQTIDKDAFIQEAAIFGSVVKNWNKDKLLYTESVFQDLSTSSYTINYMATDLKLPIQRIDILLSEETNIIKRLFIRENSSSKDTIITKQFSWVADQRFQISTSKKTNEFSRIETINLNWDKRSDK